jgi:hypothetical protein
MKPQDIEKLNFLTSNQHSRRQHIKNIQEKETLKISQKDQRSNHRNERRDNKIRKEGKIEVTF